MTYISYVTTIRSEGILAEWRFCVITREVRGNSKGHILGFINSSEIPLTTV